MRTRLFRFYAVGLGGVGVQLTALALFVDGFGWHHAISTALAVEIAVIHNFVWHERWTWASRGFRSAAWERFCKFNLSTGLISVVANVVATAGLIELCGVPYLAANGLAIVSASVANYLAADSFAFRA